MRSERSLSTLGRVLLRTLPSRLDFLASSLGRRLDAGAAEPLQEGDQVRAAGAVLDVERVRLLAPPPWIEERFHGRNGSVVQEERLAGQIHEEARAKNPGGRFGHWHPPRPACRRTGQANWPVGRTGAFDSPAPLACKPAIASPDRRACTAGASAGRSRDSRCSAGSRTPACRGRPRPDPRRRPAGWADPRDTPPCRPASRRRRASPSGWWNVLEAARARSPARTGIR